MYRRLLKSQHRKKIIQNQKPLFQVKVFSGFEFKGHAFKAQEENGGKYIMNPCIICIFSKINHMFMLTKI